MPLEVLTLDAHGGHVRFGYPDRDQYHAALHRTVGERQVLSSWAVLPDGRTVMTEIDVHTGAVVVHYSEARSEERVQLYAGRPPSRLTGD